MEMEVLDDGSTIKCHDGRDSVQFITMRPTMNATENPSKVKGGRIFYAGS